MANSNVVITGHTVILVPYKKEHVTQYHEWMKDPELLELTKSEPLTLEEEFKMQESWNSDAQKTTFILLDKSLPGNHGGAMAGDVNLYWNVPDNSCWAEIEVMVAEKCSRRKGIAQEALHTMMCYAIGTLKAQGFTAKITTGNMSSRALFEKIGFVRVKDVPCFDEVHYEMSSSLAPEAWESLVVDVPLLHGFTTAWEAAT